MNIFGKLKEYATSFVLKNTRNFDEDEISQVKSAKVVASQFGLSVCFFMREGCQKYIPLSRDSQACVGDSVDLYQAKILTLEKDGEIIHRIEI